MENNKNLKRVLLANDLAGLGKVALANAIPIMACAKIETSILPTVILSSHTGGFSDIYIDDYTAGMDAFLKQWKNLNIAYDAIVTGYLKSEKAIDLLLEYKETRSVENALLIVDPIMGDSGKFYKGFDDSYANKMSLLCKNADYIIPNVTEACLLTETKELLKESHQRDEIELIFDKLIKMGSKNIIISGVSFDKEHLAVAFYEENKGEIEYIFTENLPYKFFGTGDLFTALISACIVRGVSLKSGIEFAVSWLEKCLKFTISLNRDLKLGVYYEAFLGELVNEVDKLAVE